MEVARKKRGIVRRIFKVLIVLVMIPAGAVAVLLVAMRLEHSAMETSLPAPTGEFAVGRAVYDWVDEKSLDTLAPVAGAKRELLVWIWYPATSGSSLTNDEYLPGAMREEVVRDRGPLFSKFLTRDLSKVQAHGIWNADVAAAPGTFPVVMMRAGASAEVWNYTTLAEDLASHGYVVVGFDAPYRTNMVAFPDGRVMNRTQENNAELCEGQEYPAEERCAERVMSAWIGDTGFVLDRLGQLNASDATGKFTERFDMARLGVFGHSFGGATAAQFCSVEARCKAGIDVDGQLFGSVVQDGMQKPFMFLMGDHSREKDPESAQIMGRIQGVYEKLPPKGRQFITIRGSNHFLFSDDGAVMKSHIFMGILRILRIVRIAGPRQLDVTTYCVRSFFDAYLKVDGGARVRIASPDYPEIEAGE
jgi:dienelactone hydrolase